MVRALALDHEIEGSNHTITRFFFAQSENVPTWSEMSHSYHYNSRICILAFILWFSSTDFHVTFLLYLHSQCSKSVVTIASE